ncbi:MAG: hypothetical protein ACK559_15530, partial [bacterium]
VERAGGRQFLRERRPIEGDSQAVLDDRRPTVVDGVISDRLGDHEFRPLEPPHQVLGRPATRAVSPAVGRVGVELKPGEG